MIVGSWNHLGKKKNSTAMLTINTHIYTKMLILSSAFNFYAWTLGPSDLNIVHKLICNIGSNCFLIIHCLDVLNSQKKKELNFFFYFASWQSNFPKNLKINTIMVADTKEQNFSLQCFRGVLKRHLLCQQKLNECTSNKYFI